MFKGKIRINLTVLSYDGYGTIDKGHVRKAETNKIMCEVCISDVRKETRVSCAGIKWHLQENMERNQREQRRSAHKRRMLQRKPMANTKIAQVHYTKAASEVMQSQF